MNFSSPRPAVDNNDEESRFLLPRVESQGGAARSSGSGVGISRVAALALVCALTVCALFTSGVPGVGSGRGAVDLQQTEPDAPAVPDWLPSECPGTILQNGVWDPRDVVLSSASLAGKGVAGDYQEHEASIFLTSEFNKNNVKWLVATRTEEDKWVEAHFQMVLVRVASVNNNIVLCALEAGEVALEKGKKLDFDNVMLAWSARDPTPVATCDTCDGFGVKFPTLKRNTKQYDPSENKFEQLDFLPPTCPGTVTGFAEGLSNVTVEQVDSYAGVLYMGGLSVDKGSHPAVLFPGPPAADSQTVNYIGGYVDFGSDDFRMVQVQLSIIDGLVKMCVPSARVMYPHPSEINHTNILSIWNSSPQANVASCIKCAGYGVATFKYSVRESAAPSPEPSTAPSPEPTVEPTVAPTVVPTSHPTELPEGAYYGPGGIVLFYPVAAPTAEPIVEPTFAPIPGPTFFPISVPTHWPTPEPTVPEPTLAPVVLYPTPSPSATPTAEPTREPVVPPTMYPVNNPTAEPVANPTLEPTAEPTIESTIILGRPCDVSDDYKDQGGVTINGTSVEMSGPTEEPTFGPTYHAPEIVNGQLETPAPTFAPSFFPTSKPTLPEPTAEPTLGPTVNASLVVDGVLQTAPPTYAPSLQPTSHPTTGAPTVPGTIEPCVDRKRSPDGQTMLNSIYAPTATNSIQFNLESMKSCENFPGFLSSMTLVATVPRKEPIVAAVSVSPAAIKPQPAAAAVVPKLKPQPAAAAPKLKPQPAAAPKLKPQPAVAGLTAEQQSFLASVVDAHDAKSPSLRST